MPCCVRLQECVKRLEVEMKQEYDHTMNRITFEKVVRSHPEEFPNITLPQPQPWPVPRKGVHICIFVCVCVCTCTGSRFPRNVLFIYK